MCGYRCELHSSLPRAGQRWSFARAAAPSRQAVNAELPCCTATDTSPGSLLVKWFTSVSCPCACSSSATARSQPREWSALGLRASKGRCPAPALACMAFAWLAEPTSVLLGAFAGSRSLSSFRLGSRCRPQLPASRVLGACMGGTWCCLLHIVVRHLKRMPFATCAPGPTSHAFNLCKRGRAMPKRLSLLPLFGAASTQFCP